jgi:hypothetical protein
MMGRRKREQGQFFYAFDLDKVASPDHLVRQIDGTRSATSSITITSDDLSRLALPQCHLASARHVIKATINRAKANSRWCAI